MNNHYCNQYVTVLKLTTCWMGFFLFAIFLFEGTGKTMVMDMFYSHLEVERKKRVHFHGFMLDVHQSKWRYWYLQELYEKVLTVKKPDSFSYVYYSSYSVIFLKFLNKWNNNNKKKSKLEGLVIVCHTRLDANCILFLKYLFKYSDVLHTWLYGRLHVYLRMI